MKSEFPEYYYDFEAMWSEAIFVFDANVLLNVYRFSPAASKDLLNIMNRLNDRIWIPYQFAAEYHRNLHTVTEDIDKIYRDKKDELEKLSKRTIKDIEDFSSPTSFNVSAAQFKSVKGAFAKITEKLSEFEEKHKESLSKEDIQGQIAELFDSNVGQQISLSDRKKIFTEGKKRYEDRIPPGYKDRSKAKPYGDLVGWTEIKEYAKEKATSIIMVSDDNSSDDWFQKAGDKATGPRRELVDEMRKYATVDFYLYETWQLLDFANQYLPDLKDKVTETTIEEAKHLSESRRQMSEERRMQERTIARLEREGFDVWDWADDSDEFDGEDRTPPPWSSPVSIEDIPF